MFTVVPNFVLFRRTLLADITPTQVLIGVEYVP